MHNNKTDAAYAVTKFLSVKAIVNLHPVTNLEIRLFSPGIDI